MADAMSEIWAMRFAASRTGRLDGTRVIA